MQSTKNGSEPQVPASFDQGQPSPPATKTGLLIEEMRQVHREIVESDGGECDLMRMQREAANEIERLREVNDDLLNALREIVYQFDADQIRFTENANVTRRQSLEVARAAIAKAEGR